ncbi:MAG: serine protease, partial [Clostridia bacterium]|nr:serine protease [Clostridia bacterium]
PQPTRAPAATAQPTASGNVGDYTTLSVSAQELSAWKLINADREANGLPALPLDEELCAMARIKSCDMNQNHYFDHNSPTYGRAADMLKFFGYSYRGVGENIAHYGTIEKAEAGFMSSSGHRANILGSQWTKVGVGVCVDSNGFVYVTQIFVR